MQPSTARISGNILLEDIPVQLTAVCGMPQDRQRYGTGNRIMAAINRHTRFTVDTPIYNVWFKTDLNTYLRYFT
jgi:hypothetical protein